MLGTLAAQNFTKSHFRVWRNAKTGLDVDVWKD
jgi:hypothetical protein